jgi:sulfonate transport system ATP-binding protein
MAQMSGGACVVLEGVAKAFPSKGATPVEVLADCSFRVEPGTLTVLMGPSGCGKTTLCYLIAGYLAPDAGRVLLDGNSVTGPGPDRLLVFQETALWPWMTVLDNILFGPLSRGRSEEAAARAEAVRLLERFGLQGFGDRYPDQLSGGMRRRAELAQALINRPRVMVLDEPFRGLDVMTRELMQEYYLRLYEEMRLTTLFVTSELEEAILLADRILFMGHTPGRILRELAVDLPHPRTVAALTSERYLEIKRVAMADLAACGAMMLE